MQRQTDSNNLSTSVSEFIIGQILLFLSFMPSDVVGC